MFTLLKKELNAYFNHLTGYIVIGIFLLLTGLFLWVIHGEYNILDTGYANVDGLFYLAPWLFLFLCPAVTMQLIAEEKQVGTWEMLVSKPISKLEIVLGKYMAGLLLVLLSLTPTLLYYFSVYNLAEPMGNIDSGSFWGSFIGLFFLAAVYVSVGLFASSISPNQIVSFIVAIVISFFFYFGFEMVASFLKVSETRYYIENMGIHEHYQSMSRGVIDSRDILYFFIVTGCFLYITIRKIRK